MDRFVRFCFALAVLAMAGAVTASCRSNDGTNPLSPPELQGTYDLISLSLPGQPVILPPAATGGLALTLPRYSILVHVTGQPDLVDSGTYSLHKRRNPWHRRGLRGEWL